MKKIIISYLTAMLVLSTSLVTLSATSLDDIINEEQAVAEQVVETQQEEPVQNNSQDNNTNTDDNNSNLSTSSDSYIASMKDATDLSGVDTAGTSKVNDGIKKVAAFIVKVASYFLTAFLVVRIMIDLVYIGLPFCRSLLSNGYGGNASAAGGMNGMNGMGMNGMGMNGMGMGGYGMHNRYGMGGMGMNGMGGMGMNGMGMNGMQGNQAGASPSMGRIQWVSSAALNAVAAEQVPGPDGKPQSALKIYAKDMMVVLIVTPLLLTLAVSGTFTDLGFLIGEVIANGISNIGGMI